MAVQVLAVSDMVDPRIHSASLRHRMPGVTRVFGCGDVPATYLEFLADALDKPVYFVFGNHQEELLRLGVRGHRYQPLGCVNLGSRVVRDDWTGLILAGLPGSPRYGGNGTEQYSEFEVYGMIARMTPRLLWNRLRHGRALDVLITHAPPRDVNDAADVAHRGFKAIRSFLRWFRPAYQLHGHVHLYDRSQSAVTTFEQTEVINVYPFQVLDLHVPVREPAAEGDNSPVEQPSAARPAPERVPKAVVAPAAAAMETSSERST
jgi:hypothetical protein